MDSVRHSKEVNVELAGVMFVQGMRWQEMICCEKGYDRAGQPITTMDRTPVWFVIDQTYT